VNYQTHAVGAAVCAAITAVAAFAGYRPALLAIEAAQRDDIDLREARAELSDLHSTRRALINQRSRTQGEMDRLAVAFEPVSAVNEHLAHLASLAEDLGVVIDELQPGRVEPGELFNTVAFTMSGTAGFGTCADFIHRLHNESPDMAVRTFELTAGGDGDTRFRFEIVWFAAKD